MFALRLGEINNTVTMAVSVSSTCVARWDLREGTMRLKCVLFAVYFVG